MLKLGGGVAILGGAGGALLPSGAFTTVNANRDAPINAAAEGDGIVGIVRQNTVKKNSRDPMVEFINNGSEDIDIQVTLQNCGDGLLFNNNSNSGCSVILPLDVGQSQFVDINADVTGIIPYDVSISESGGSDFQLLTTGTVESQSGNNKAAAIRIKSPVNDNKFTANPPQGNSGNDWDVEAVDIQDDDGDDDLTEVKFEVTVSGTGVVGSKTVTLNSAAEYKLSGNELPLKITPDDPGYTIQSGTQYTLTTRGTDADGNFATSTVDDTP